jgi:uncharacterized protein with HEPN domain
MSSNKRDYLLFLEDIVEAIVKIEEYTKNLSQAAFFGSNLIQDAVIRNFEVIGEAVKNIPKRVQQNYPQVEWREAAGFRDVLIHNYFGIDVDALWDTICSNIPVFKEHILDVLKQEKETIDSESTTNGRA